MSKPRTPAPSTDRVQLLNEDHAVVPTVRRVAFDWSNTPLHWVPGDPFSTHTLNVLNLIIPAVEWWFIHVYKQVLPRITDDLLRDQVKAFMGQESVHAQNHTFVQEHLASQGLDCAPYVRRIEFMFEQVLGDNTAPRSLRHTWLEGRVAAIAGLEHYTAVLGQWAMDAEALDRAGADPMMVDLYRWHGAEEVEHRSVAFDTFQHLSGSYAMRNLVMTTLVIPTFARVWIDGVKFLMVNDPTVPEKDKRPYRRGVRGDAYVLLQWRKKAKTGVLPTPKSIIEAVPQFLNPKYHPIQDGNTAQALAYIATSPAARAAQRAAS